MKAKVGLKIPQIRILRLLADGSGYSRARLSELAGYTAISGTVTRAIHGLREGSTSGPAYPGLLNAGLVEETELNMDGVKELVYTITETGLSALASLNGEASDLPSVQDRANRSTNKRYQKEP